jgi:hypothetical protein
MLSKNEVRGLLSKLCIRLGFCLPPLAIEEIADAPPHDVRGFVDAVFVAEGLDPSTADRHLSRQVRDMVSDAYAKAATAREQAP